MADPLNWQIYFLLALNTSHSSPERKISMSIDDASSQLIWQLSHENLCFATNHALALRAQGPTSNGNTQNVMKFLKNATDLYERLVKLSTQVVILYQRAKDQGQHPITHDDWKQVNEPVVEISGAIQLLEDVILENSPQNTLLEAIIRFINNYKEHIEQLKTYQPQHTIH